MTQQRTLRFVKMNGLGNEILVADLRGGERVLSERRGRRRSRATRAPISIS